MELIHDQNASQKDPICRYMQQLDQTSPTISYKEFDNKNIMVKYIVSRISTRVFEQWSRVEIIKI